MLLNGLHRFLAPKKLFGSEKYDTIQYNTGWRILKGFEAMVRWEHRYLLGTMVFTIAGDVVRDFDEEYDAWAWLEQEGWGLVAIEPPDPVKPGACKYYFKRQNIQASPERTLEALQTTRPSQSTQSIVTFEQRGKRIR
jgi:hypothetical protein